MKRVRKTTLQKAPDLPWTSVVFASSLERAHQVEEDILACCRACCFADHDLFAIKLALEEALVNAVKHGNKLDPSKRVTVQYRCTPERLDVSIEDQGAGFKPCEVPDCTAEENLEVNHGRGILLMRAYMSNVVYNARGNKVSLTKFNEGHRKTGGQAAMG